MQRDDGLAGTHLDRSPSHDENTPEQRGRSAPERRILLVDCDMFFVQVARLEDPEGAGRAKLLIVGGSADGRGVVTSADYGVRAFGVHSGMPTSQAIRLCPEATVVGVPRHACVSRSRAIGTVLRELAPRVQAASIDEFYLDFSGTERLLHGESLEASAARVRQTVLDETGISVSVGGATSRYVAKIAAGRAKPAGVFVVPPGGEATFLADFPLGKLPGIGPAFEESLERRGLLRAGDVARVELEWLVRWFGESRGRWLHDRVRGVDPSPVSEDDERKSISTERTFSSDLSRDEDLERILLELSLSVGTTLREKGLRARTVTVKLRDGDFTTRQASHTLPRAIESDRGIYDAARPLLERLRVQRRVPARLLGVGASGLDGDGMPAQLALFGEATPEESERDRTLSQMGDSLRARFGDEALLPGRLLEEGPRSRRRKKDPEK